MRLIDADALLQRAVPHGWSTPLWVSDIVIEDAPTIDAKPIQHGHWILLYTDNYKCSACGAWWAHDDYDQMDEFHYCPACGAKMDEKKE